MATAYQNLSSYDPATVPDASNMRVAIVCAEWNANITEKLLEGACNTLEKHGVKSDNIFVGRVPGTFELTFGARTSGFFLSSGCRNCIGMCRTGRYPSF